MANFSRKQNQTSGNGGAGSEAWAAWKEHCHEQHPAKKSTKAGVGGKKDRKQKICPVVANYIQDLGFPPAPDFKWAIDPSKNKKMEGHEEPTDAEGNVDYSPDAYSDWEVAFMKENKGSDFIWDKEWNQNGGENGKGAMETVRKQTSPAQPSQEYGVCVDIPSWLVYFGLHPNAPEGAPDDWRPMRISLNGAFKGEIQNPITFEVDYRTGEVRDANIIRKICIAAGRDEDLRESEWDIGVAAGAVFNMKVTSDFSQDGDYTNHNTSATTPTAIEDMYDPLDEEELIASADKIIEKVLATKGLCEFTGVLLDMEMEDLTDDLMKMVYSTGSAHAFLKRAEMSQSVLIEGTSKAGKEYSFEKGVDYDTTNFAKALEKWKKKQDKSGDSVPSKVSGKGSSAEGKQTPKGEAKASTEPAEKAPKVNASKPEPVKSEHVVLDDEDLDIPF